MLKYRLWTGKKNKYKGSNPFILYLTAFAFIIISVAAILCVPKEITMIQQEVSHLSFMACWPECINPAAAAGMDGSFVFIQFSAHHRRLSLTSCLSCDNVDWIHHFDCKFKWQ